MDTVTVFGASGRTGMFLVKEALLRGLHVRAHCRPGSPLRVTDNRLKVIRGDILDPGILRQAMEGAACVFMAIGPHMKEPEPFTASATAGVILSMKECGCRRLLCVTGAMIGEGYMNRTLPFSLMARLARRKMPGLMDDRETQEAAVKHSGLDWTIFKPPLLTDGPRREEIVHGEGISMGLGSKLGRADLARFMLDAAGSGSFIHKAVFLRY